MKYLLALFLSFISFLALSEDEGFRSEKSKQLVKELKYSVNHTIAKILEYEKEAGAGDKSVHFNIEQTSATEKTLGLLVSKNREVILVSPSSPAERLGIKAGDTIRALSFNEQALDLASENWLKKDGLLIAEIVRDGTYLTLKETIKLSDTPIWRLEFFANTENYEQLDSSVESMQYDDNACGKVSVFFTPPSTKDLYKSYFTKINDKVITNRYKEIYKLKPGKHIIEIHELFVFKGLTSLQRKNYNSPSKSIELLIEPNKIYSLAAKFEKSHRHKKRPEEHWEPIVWKVSETSCEL
ncbi:hypothetical protein [Kangiella sp. TOML190]|uniref:hypothetical protein n=1 Tax=Kangiella sp. TOML190 TaxID=2931351 RepID=UPI0020424943|nr:hypothetical protein [Kangiella sp. TOML190]